jgi:hypothetical protein
MNYVTEPMFGIMVEVLESQWSTSFCKIMMDHRDSDIPTMIPNMPRM